MKKLVVIAALVSIVVWAGAGAFGEEGGGRARQRAWLLEQAKENAPPEILALIEKRLAGEALTPEEVGKLKDYIRQHRASLREQLKENAPDEIKAIIEKREAGERLTPEERTALKNYIKEKTAERRGDVRKNIRERVKENAPEEIKAIMEKREAGERLTRGERKQLAEYIRGLRH